MFTLPEAIYVYINEYALYVGGALIIASLFLELFQRKQLNNLLLVQCGLMSVFGVYLVLWNFRIIDIPYRPPDSNAQYKVQAVKANQQAAQQVDFKTFNLSYRPNYVQSWARITSVLLLTTNVDQDQSKADDVQVNIEYAKYLKGMRINSAVTILSETKPVADIRQEFTPRGSCTTSNKLDKYVVIGHNDAGGGILKGTTFLDTAYLTDYLGTRLVLEDCHISDTGLLTDQDAVKMFHDLVPFDIKTADFSDPRT